MRTFVSTAMRWVGATLMVALTCARAASWVEDFATDPAARGWTTQGDPSLFRWDPAGQRLGATWDSTRTNTFFHRQLDTILGRADSFRLGFTLQLGEINTASPDGTFQLAVGFLRRADAFRDNLRRGSGIHAVTGARDIVEFNYFPASRAISPTLATVAVGTNYLRWSMANLFPFELTAGPLYRVALGFDAATQTLRLEVRRDGELWASGETRLDDRFGDVRLDAISVTSYSGAGQPAGYGGDILARGWIDDLAVDLPDPPALRLTLLRDGPDSRSRITVENPPAGWTTTLETASESIAWSPVGVSHTPDPGGTHRTWTLPPFGDPARYYRLRLDRP